MSALTPIAVKVLTAVRRMCNDVKGIAASTGESTETVSAVVVSLNGADLIDYYCGTWHLTPAGTNALAALAMEAAS